ncbi:MAG: GumC family protein [Acidobacteriota bacterium]
MELTNVAQSDRREVHLLEYWRVIWSGKWTIAAVSVVVLATVAIATFLQTPVYRATVRVEVSPRTKSVAPGSDFSQLGAGWGWLAEERYLNTQLEILKSRDLAARVLQDLGLDQVPGAPRVGDPVEALRSRIEVEAIPDANILEISMEGTDPAEIQRRVNTLARVYVDRNVEIAVEATSRTLDELLRQMQPLREKIRTREHTLLAMAREKKLYIPESQTTTMGERISQLQAELTNVQIERGRLEAVFQEISRLESEGGDYQTLPQVADDEAVQDLDRQAKSLEKDLERMSVSYLDKHPKMIEARSQLAEIRRKLGREIDRIISKIKAEHSIARQRERNLEERLTRAKEESLDLTVASTDYKILKSEIQEDKRIYDLILSRIKEIDLNQETLNNNIRVLDQAVLPTAPVRPRKALNLLAGGLLGLLLGMGTVIFMDYLDNTVKSAEDVEQYLGLHILAVVPRKRKDTSSSVKEAFQTLRTSLLFSSKARSLNTLLVTSAGPGEGKTSTGVGLARKLASAGDRVILVDADLRRPTVHTQLGIERGGGLTNYLLSTEGGQAWLRYLKEIPAAPNLKAITCGPIPPNPPELFSTEKFIDLMTQLKKNFDWVVLDSPPLASLSDSLVLASLVDMVALVIKHNQNDRDLIRRSTVSLKKINANIIGAVLNNIDLSRSTYKDYYYAGYYYYGRGREEEDVETPVEAGERA